MFDNRSFTQNLNGLNEKIFPIYNYLCSAHSVESEKTYSAMTTSISSARTPFSHMWKPGIQFGENGPGVSRPFDLPSRVGKVNTFKTLIIEMHLHFDSDV